MTKLNQYVCWQPWFKTTRVKRSVFSWLLISITLALPAQQAKQYVFTRYHTGNGLASNFVNNLLQDYKGFIWLATVNGLQRYDGHKFISFMNQPGNPATIPSDNVIRIYEDRLKKLWVVTGDNRIGTFNTDNFAYHEFNIRYKLGTPLSLTIPTRLFESKDGNLFLFAERQGLYVFDRKVREFVPSDKVVPIPPGWKLNDIVQDPVTGRFWMAADSGLAVFNPASRNLSYKGDNKDNDPIVRLFESERNAVRILTDSTNFFLASLPGDAGIPVLYHYDLHSGKKIAYNLSKELKIGHHEILGRLRQRNGRIWFYGQPFIFQYTGGNKPFEQIRNEYKDEQSIRFDKVNAMYEDREENLWICSDNGVFLFNPDAQVFNTYNLLRPGGKEAVESRVLSVLPLANGNIWVSCWGSGLYCYDSNFNPIPAPAGLQHVTANWYVWCMIQERTTHKIWMGLQDGSVLVFDPSTGRSDQFKPAVFEGQPIRQVIEDRQGNIWFGSQDGHIVQWDRKTAGDDPRKGFGLFQKKGLVHKMMMDKDGFLWVAALGRGLLRIDPVTGNIKRFTRNGPPGQSLTADSPYDILQYNDSTILIANGAIDVLNTKTETIYAVTTQNGLPANNVLCLQKDKNGTLWLGMINGLCRVHLETEVFINYDRRDGITYDNFNPAGAFQLPDSRLVFTTDHNFLVFDPEEMVQRNPPPDVKILDFKIADKSLLVDSLMKLNKITLEDSKNSISIFFGTLSYLRKNKKVFYYKLDRIDEDWVLADEFHKAMYNHLSPGNYTFRVKSVNGYGIQSKNITTLTIFIKPPFWKTWWFYGIIILISVAILYWIDRERVRRLLILQEVRTQIASNLHQDINTTLNNIHLLSEIAKIKADKDLAKSKEYIDQINTKSRKMMDDMDDMLWSIDPANDSMEKTLERMNEFAEGLRNTHDCSIQLLVDEKVKSLNLDMKSRHEIFFIFKEALNSIVQHSQCSDAIVHVDKVNSTLSIKIHDNGTGLESQSIHTMNGMEEMKKRAAILNAMLDIQSDKKGSSVILQVPLA